MKQKICKQISSFIFCMMLIVATAFFTTGCNGDTGNNEVVDKSDTGKEVVAETTVPTTAASDGETATPAVSGQDGLETGGNAKSDDKDKKEATVLGEGKTSFDFMVIDSEGKETNFKIHTDKKTVGDALSELKLIDGEEGDYGLYVKTVNGITVDYDKDGEYWAFYINDKYAQTGVDTTNIKDGDSYSLVVEK